MDRLIVLIQWTQEALFPKLPETEDLLWIVSYQKSKTFPYPDHICNFPRSIYKSLSRQVSRRLKFVKGKGRGGAAFFAWYSITEQC